MSWISDRIRRVYQTWRGERVEQTGLPYGEPSYNIVRLDIDRALEENRNKLLAKMDDETELIKFEFALKTHYREVYSRAHWEMHLGNHLYPMRTKENWRGHKRRAIWAGIDKEMFISFHDFQHALLPFNGSIFLYNLSRVTVNQYHKYKSVEDLWVALKEKYPEVFI